MITSNISCRSEVHEVYNDIFLSDDLEGYRRALQTLKTWKVRMSAFYSVGLSATLALLEADVKSADPRYTPEDVQVWYSTAFNRFLNYAHSLTMTQCSMYGAAKELGIHSFIVDIRHLCSHSSALPRVDTFLACSVACKKWLRLFYWDNLLKEAKDVTVKDLPVVSGTDGITKELEFLLKIYDFTSHQLWRRKKVTGEVDKAELTDAYVQYARSLESDNLMMIRAQLLKDCSVILESNRGKLSTIHIFCRLVVEQMAHFLSDATQEQSMDVLAITVVHQNFFHMIANVGIVGEILRKFLTTCIDSSVDQVTRKGAGYWAAQVLKTCKAYYKIRKAQLEEMSPEELLNLNWDSINTKSLDKTIERGFYCLGLQRENSLIFGVGKRNFWEIKFSREFVNRQLKHTNVENKEAHLGLIYFADPPLPEKFIVDFQELISSFVDPLKSEMEKSKEIVDVSMDYEIKDPADVEVIGEKEAADEDDDDSDLGLWSAPDEGVNWERCAIGTHLWHVEAAQ